MTETEQSRQVAILNEAITAGNLSAVWTLLDNGVSAHAADHFGQTPMFVAVREGQPEIVSLLLARGVDVNAPVERTSGRNALYYAADRGHVDVVQVLLDAGAQVNVIESHGHSALWACAQSLASEVHNMQDKENWLRQQNTHPTGRVATAELLIQHGADVSLKPGHLHSPAHFLRSTGLPRLVALIEAREKRPSFWARLFRGE